jgi:tRNA(adenine34) deaminase
MKPQTEPLDETEWVVLDFVVELLLRDGRAPSLREVGAAAGMSARRAGSILDSLARKGWVERDHARARGIRVPEFVVAGRSARWPCPEFEPAVTDDETWMREALEQAVAAERVAEVPVGAVLVRGERVLARAFNLTRTGRDPTAHAEMGVIRQAADTLGDARLPGATLYVTLEPCAMCAGAIVLARLERLVYATSDPKTGMCGSLGCIVQDRRLNHRVRLTRGVLAEEAGALLRRFFRARR